ncbi:2-oxoglutarate (2OG) and Fe(II)-dependent oxygenase superfamily [Salix suchowensis]|nr:2-oxoglutarate (2OG) and Fe(II)-dependent oxygenase superfamily [Salix suchowensis]
METLGPTGPGLLSITGVPKASILRQRLLPLARKLALLDHDRRKHILKEHNLGSDVPLKNPDRNVSSFAMQLKYAQALESAVVKTNNGPRCNSNLEPAHMDDNNNEVTDSPENEFENLADTFRELGYCMMELGLRVAQICDMAIGGQELERSLLESGTAKGRLIHYHSVLDNLLVKASGRRKGSTKNRLTVRRTKAVIKNTHVSYVLSINKNTATDQFPVSCDQDCACPTGHSYLQIFDANKNDVFMVKTSSESFIIQVGESADILSRGKLSSTLHCVRRPPYFENLSRETFVVFLQPAWSKTSHSQIIMCNMACQLDFNEAAQDIHKIVPPLSSRLKDGMTFAEFSRETTKQYYGGSGLQSNS